MKQERGVIYMAYGNDRFFNEAVSSVKSFKKIKAHKEIETCLLSTDDVSTDIISNFDRFIKINKTSVNKVGETKLKKNFQFKLLMYDYSPYDLTLFLDCDTYVCKDITVGYSAANSYKFAACMADSWYRLGAPISRLANVHPDYTQFNSGVLFFKKDPIIHKVFNDALQLSIQDGMARGDQAYINASIYKNNINPYMLHHKFMCKGYGYNMGNKKHCSNEWRDINGPYSILHHPNIANIVNNYAKSIKN